MTMPTHTLSAEEKRALIEKLLRRASAASDYPLSPLQQRLWLFEQLEPGTSIYNNTLAIRLSGTLDGAVLERCVAEVVARHEALRVGFIGVNGRPVQRVSKQVAMALPMVDLTGLAADARDRELMAIQSAQSRRPFELTTPPLIRFTLVRLGEDEHELVVTVHQAVCDGWSLTLLLKEISTLYGDFVAGRPSSLPTARQFPRIAGSHSDAGDARMQADLEYWTEKLADCPPVTEWPADLARPENQTYAGAVMTRVLSAELTSRITAVSGAHRATPFMTLMAALKAVVFQQTGQEDLVIGAPIAGRTDPAMAGVVGGFVNTVALRDSVRPGMSFVTLLESVRRTALESYTHQSAPFDAIVERIGMVRDPARSPVYQIFLNLLNLPMKDAAMPGISGDLRLVLEMDAKFDLTFYVLERGGELHVHVVYNPRLYLPGTIATVLGRFERALDVFSRDVNLPVGRTPLGAPPMSSARSPIPAGPAFTPVPATAIESSIVARIEEQVDRRGAHDAVTGPSGRWTYAELDRRANAIAFGVEASIGSMAATVALLCDDDCPMIAAMLGTLKAGHAYVPLDPLSPEDRLAFVFADSGARLIVADRANRALAERLCGRDRVLEVESCGLMEERPGIAVDPGALAYLLYTSGSTGQPKAVMQSHRNVLHFMRIYANNLRIDTHDRLSLVSSYGFDAALMDIFAALTTGATLAIAAVRRRGLGGLGAWIREERITVYHSTPTVFRRAFGADVPREWLESVRVVVMGGEEVLATDFERFRTHFPSHAWFVNGLGPTECTVAMQHFLSASATMLRSSVPVGLPVDETIVELLDSEGGRAELYGELVIRSPHIALGYWNRPDLTAAAFAADPIDGSRHFRTGDVLRWLPDGLFEFVGRRDSQVKIRGFRIDLGEIEAVLASHPDVHEAAVVARQEDDRQLSLVAYVTLHPGQAVDDRSLSRWVRARLPLYMVPSVIGVLDRLPLTPSGKIKRAALAELTPPLPSPRSSVAPSTPTEETLARLWAELLGIRNVDREDDFFLIGGDSLRATQMVSRVAQQFDVTLPLRTVFTASTLMEVAAAIDSIAGGPVATAGEEREEWTL